MATNIDCLGRESVLPRYRVALLKIYNSIRRCANIFVVWLASIILFIFLSIYFVIIVFEIMDMRSWMQPVLI
jgi:hypothetical protein